MNTDRHTSGPWHADSVDRVRNARGIVIARCERNASHEYMDHAEQSANARLCAAAPALLAALRDLIPLASEGVRFLDYGAVRPDEWESADKARAMLAAACATLTAVEGC